MNKLFIKLKELSRFPEETENTSSKNKKEKDIAKNGIEQSTINCKCKPKGVPKDKGIRD